MADVLIIDDDKLICDILARMMGKNGHESSIALTGKDGLALAKDGMFDIVFLDINLPDANGLDLIKTIKTTPSSPEIIIITGDSDPDGAEMAINCGAWNYLEKPFLRQEIDLQVSRALQFRKEKGNVSTRGSLKRNNIIGESEDIKFCLDQASTAAYSESNVLITGEPGTGKELFAKTIHLNSDRFKHNFVVVDCCAINENNVESTLYGHKQGAFPGAVNSRTGLIKHADNGTLFLDEISALPKPVQKYFLKVLGNLEFTPKGSAKKKTSNFRVIATTSQNLDELSEQGKFRKDLFLKIKEMTIHLPALRDMKADIIKTALFYIDQYCKKYKVDTKGLSPEFLEIISAFEWPGNVRELMNAIDKAVASAKNEPTLYSIHLPSYVKATVIKNSRVRNSKNDKINSETYAQGRFPLLKVMMEMNEKEYLTELLSYTNGCVAKACAIAGVSKSCMYARLKKYGLKNGWGHPVHPNPA